MAVVIAKPRKTFFITNLPLVEPQPVLTVTKTLLKPQHPVALG